MLVRFLLFPNRTVAVGRASERGLVGSWKFNYHHFDELLSIKARRTETAIVAEWRKATTRVRQTAIGWGRERRSERAPVGGDESQSESGRGRGSGRVSERHNWVANWNWISNSSAIGFELECTQRKTSQRLFIYYAAVPGQKTKRKE